MRSCKFVALDRKRSPTKPRPTADYSPSIASRRPRTSRRADSSSAAIGGRNDAYGSGGITPRPPQQPNDRSPASGGVTHRGLDTARTVIR